MSAPIRFWLTVHTRSAADLQSQLTRNYGSIPHLFTTAAIRLWHFRHAQWCNCARRPDFSKQRLINLTRRDQVLFNSTIGLSYDIKEEQLQRILKSLRDLLVSHPHVKADTAKANLSAFSNSAMELKIAAELVDAAASELPAIREDLLLKMLTIVGREGAKMVAH